MKFSKNILVMACATTLALTAPAVGFAKASDRGKSQGQGIGNGLTETVREHDSRRFHVQKDGSLPFDALENATTYWGVYEGIQGDASYTAEFPENWNGGVIMYTHGFRGEGSLLTKEVPNDIFESNAFRRKALERGYAWAASSYSANYYDVRAAIEDTNRLALELTDYLERDWPEKWPSDAQEPNRYLIAGVSMGGHAAAAAVERETLENARYKVKYAGALPLCQAEQNEFQWLGDYNRLVRELGGFGNQSYENYPQYVGQALSNLFEFDNGAPTYVPKNEAGQRLKDIAMNLTGGERPIFDEGFRNPTWQGAVLGTGGRDGTVTGILANEIYDNKDRLYRWTDGEPATAEERLFKLDVGRFQADKGVNPIREDGVRWLPLVQGDFDVPVLTMHTLGDFFVPFVHQQLYREAAEANGSGAMLVQRAIRDPNHCGFSGAEWSTALEDLITWVETGIKPDGDEVLEPAVVADDQYGCTHTENQVLGFRSNLPQCVE